MPVYPNRISHVSHTPIDSSFWLPLSTDEKSAVSGALRRLQALAESQNDIGLAQCCRKIADRCEHLMPGLASVRVPVNVGPVVIDRASDAHFSSLDGEVVVNIEMERIACAPLLAPAAFRVIETRAEAPLPIVARVWFPNPVFRASEHYTKTDEGLRSPIGNQPPSELHNNRAIECYRNSLRLASEHSFAGFVLNMLAT